MTTSDLLRFRLYNQLLSGHHLKKTEDVVAWMGAMQSQSLDLAKWAIGVRLQGKTVKDVEDAFNTGKIIRTHILRPTWHYVSAEDIYWMSELSKPRLKPIYRSYCKGVGADESFIKKGVPLVEKSLLGGKHLTKQEISDFLAARDIRADARHLNLIISYAEMEDILCNGKLRGNKQTYTLLEEWVPQKQRLSKEEALERLTRTYFTSHGSASLPDFIWWSGLTLTDCRRALDMIKNDFICKTVNGRDFWMKKDIQIPPLNTDSVLLLPPFDEFVVSYKDRSEIIEKVHYGKVMTKNGLFSPTIMLNGKIIGSWKKINTKGSSKVELSFFEKIPKKTENLFNSEIKRVEQFY